MEDGPLTFERKGFPSIKVFENHFEIKATDYWEYKSFPYSDIKDIKHYNPNNNWWTRLYISTSIAGQIFSKNDPWILKIIRNNGGERTYKTSYQSNSDFRRIIKLIKNKLDN